MQDAQVPTDPEDGASDQPRRAGIRLRDTEAVATARRDMFGDGSLLDTLAGSPAAPANAEGPPDPAAPAKPAAPSQPAAAEGQADPAQGAAPAEVGNAAAPGLADTAQSLDAIIDSFPMEPPAGAPQRPGEEGAGADLGAPLPDASAASDATGPSPDSTPPMGISSLFDSLGGTGQRVDDAPPVEEPPAPGPPTLALDMSMLEIRVRARPAQVPESDPPTAASLTGAPPAHLGSEPHEAQAHEVQAGVAEADEAHAGEPQDGRPDLDMSMLERPPARRVLQADGDPYESHGGHPLSPEGEVQPDRVPRYDAAPEPDALAPDGREPPFAETAGSPPFSGRVAPPSFPERPDAADAQAYPGPAALPDFAEPGQAVRPPPFLEPLVMPGRSEPLEPEIAPGYEEPMAAPAFRGLSESADARAVPEPLVMPAYAEPADAEARPMFDAAYKIATEAQATADALDNLKRMLAHTDLGQQEPIAPGEGHMRLNLHGDPTPFPSGGLAALIPMPAPMPEPPARGRFGRIYLLGFLTGLGLSLMAGIALYVLINVM